MNYFWGTGGGECGISDGGPKTDASRDIKPMLSRQVDYGGRNVMIKVVNCVIVSRETWSERSAYFQPI
jgi:hypothetical protein